MEVKEFLGLDVGKARTGIARGSSGAKIAEPLKTVKTKDIFTVLPKIIEDNKVTALVVGLPRSNQDTDNKQTVWIREFVDKAKKRISLPFYWQDEALTTKLAEAEEAAGKKAEIGTDAMAASIILQDFLDSPETERAIC